MVDEQQKYVLNRWKNAFGQYENLKAEAERSVVRWEYTTWERYSPLPFYFQRFPGRGRVLKEDPTTSALYFVQYGFDEKGRVRMQVECQKVESSSTYMLMMKFPVSFVEDSYYRERTFYIYSENLIESIKYSVDPHIPLNIQQIFLENGRVIFHTWFKLNGYNPLMGEKGKDPEELYEWLGYNGRIMGVESYFYDENRLSRIVGHHENPGLPPYTANDIFTYDQAGKLSRIDQILENGQKRVIYQKRQKGQTFKKIQEEATQKLVDAIMQKIKTANIQERVYCIELCYQQCSEYFPPYIAVVPESYRSKLLQSSDSKARFNIYRPIIEKNWFYSIDDPETLEICQILEQEIHTGKKWVTATRILRDVAAILTRQDWSNILDVTPDFIVFALDGEMEGDQMVDVLSRHPSTPHYGEDAGRRLGL